MNFTKNFKSVKIRFYNVTSNCEVFASTVENDFSAIDYQRCYQDQGVRDQDQTKTRQAETETKTKTRQAETETETKTREAETKTKTSKSGLDRSRDQDQVSRYVRNVVV